MDKFVQFENEVTVKKGKKGARARATFLLSAAQAVVAYYYVIHIIYLIKKINPYAHTFRIQQ